jgi:hypothetical protein
MLRRFMVSVTVVTVTAITMPFAGSAMADVSPDKPGRTPQHGPPLTSGGNGAQVTHCNADSGEKGNIVFSVHKGEKLHDNCSGPA